MKFLAIDFETADTGADSACAVGLVRVEDGKVVEKAVRLIRPPRTLMMFTYIHGITWADVADKPGFGRTWDEVGRMAEGVDFLAAHNASFDRRVLAACTAGTGHKMPGVPFVCTVKLARNAWGVRPTTLSDVARHLALKLNHHEALSDASACAEIVLAAHGDGADVMGALLAPPRNPRPIRPFAAY